MVGLGGLDPPTSSLSGKRSNRLSYRPVVTVARRSDQQDPMTGREGKRYPMRLPPHKTVGGATGVPGRPEARPPRQPSVVCQRELHTADEGGADVVKEGHDRRD